NEVPDEMVVFMKPNSAISDDLYSFKQEQLHYEGEICLMVENGQFSAVGFGLDITKRTLQSKLKSKGLPWERAKAFNGSAVFSPFVELDEIDDSLTIKLAINGQNIQSGDVSLMMYKPDEILTELQTFMSLNDGDIIMTGTPKGVGVINKGDLFKGSIKTDQGQITGSEWTAL
ncbi:MAG: FAA hydrolase family protein, partial [Gammaproteobacteria bacterium]|nr:FAA hydrolase family protein [Gammaproteobacteria bacterium]